MSLLNRYIFRQIMIPFVLCTVIITIVAWLTQVARLLDKILQQGQGADIFFKLSMLLVPSLIGLIAPFGLLIATVYTLQRMNQDSELAVIFAAGSGKWRIVRPFLAACFLVTCFVGAINMYFGPISLQSYRTEIVKIRADLVANLAQAGRFFSPVKGVTIYFHQRSPNGDMLGVFIHDKRNRNNVSTIVALRSKLVNNETGSFMVMFDGNIQSRLAAADEVKLVTFTQYSYNLSDLSPETRVSYFKPRERFISDLYNPDPTDRYFRAFPAKVRSELHTRLISLVYPLVFTLIVLAFLANAQTSRQGQIARILLAILTVIIIRGSGVALANLSGKKDWAMVLVYGLPFLVIGLSLYAINMNRIGGFFKNKRNQPHNASTI